MRTFIIVFLILTHSLMVGAQERPAKWFNDARFGLFLHWGLYSQTAGDWKGRPTTGGEHFMLHERIPLTEYAKIANDFNPTNFSADQWVNAAKDAGMKYVVITAKHHDGFAMFDSPSSDYNIVKRTPFAKDPMKELAKACKKYGLQLCFYYSLGRDWEDPDVPTNWPIKGGRSNTWDYPNEDAKDLSKYIERKVKPQLKELLTHYGPVGIIWFDTFELVNKQQSQEIRDLILSIQPNCIINNRIGNGYGDYTVVEQSLVNSSRKNWEACITMSANWGYNKHDTTWKSAEVLIRNLTEVASKGGNLLLNIGPKGDGTFPEESKKRLKEIGSWMDINGEAIYGTQAWKITGEGNDKLKEENLGRNEKQTLKDAVNDATSQDIVPDIRFTTKGKVVYVIVRNPSLKNIRVKSMGKLQDVEIKNARILGSKQKIRWQQNGEALSFDIPQNVKPGLPIYVLAVTIK
ncbi:alpha-L-fucosidase [Sphingobacterium sp. SRCM116780]|uniref:alpha-L-fucosidase n=1 Tax=Sphingobacterium sp. SRCM116780 TaxID=2907623 RepID=UPI001F2E99E3|nr:alpha-L-fucosidase [Sphingobacterium sp. SRCM116780]UIR55882.1 alpha-L-fucosidase [Sphingobacterium sp. SRCM116780]